MSSENKDKTSVLQSSSSSRVHCTCFIRLFVVHFAVDKVAMATKTVYCFKLFTVFVITLVKIEFFREVPDSIILYYDSRY